MTLAVAEALKFNPNKPNHHCFGISFSLNLERMTLRSSQSVLAELCHLGCVFWDRRTMRLPNPTSKSTPFGQFMLGASQSLERV